MESLEAFYKKSGLNSDSPAELLEEAKKEHRRLYQKQYQALRKSKILRLGLSLTPAEHKLISKKAKLHGLPVTTFAKAAVFAYLEKRYIVPNEETIQILELSIRKIANNINQLVRYIHSSRKMDLQELEAINELLSTLEHEINCALRNPPEVG